MLVKEPPPVAVNRRVADRAGLTDRAKEPADHKGLPTRSAIKHRQIDGVREPAKTYAVFACAIALIAPLHQAVKPGHGIDRGRRRIGRDAGKNKRERRAFAFFGASRTSMPETLPGLRRGLSGLRIPRVRRIYSSVLAALGE